MNSHGNMFHLLHIINKMIRLIYCGSVTSSTGIVFLKNITYIHARCAIKCFVFLWVKGNHFNCMLWFHRWQVNLYLKIHSCTTGYILHTFFGPLGFLTLMAVAQIPECQSSHVTGTMQQHNCSCVSEGNNCFLLTFTQRHIGIKNVRLRYYSH